MKELCPTENIMGTMPVPKLILRTSIPLMLSLLMNSLYNFVDSVFVSHVSEEALTALTLAAPIQMLMGALGCGIAVGLNSVISKALGEKDPEKVRDTTTAAMVMAAVCWLLISFCGLLFLRPYFAWQSGGNESIAAYGEAYLKVCMILSLGLMGQWVFDRFLIATGKSVLFLCTLGCAAVVNLILDPIFIFGWFGLPAMETTGAAIATVIGQFSGALLGVFLNRKCNPEIPVVFTLKVKFIRVKDILRVGVPTSMMQGVVSILGIVMNSLLLTFSSTAVAVYGACSRVQNIVTVGVYGISNALIPIMAYNYGARKRERVEQSLRWSMVCAFIIGGVMLLFLEFFPRQVLALFDASDAMLEIGVPALRILALAYTASTAGVLYSSSFQALGMGNYSMYLTVARQALFLLPMAVLFAWTGNLNLVWSSFLFAELLALPLAFYLYRRVNGKILMKIEKQRR